MVDLSRTYMAVEKLLELLRCDHCNAPLHQPFTTGACEHLLCPECRLGGTASKRNESCPVCLIPVRPKDCQLHPQIAQLVLVARRLKKLTLPNSVDTCVVPGSENKKPTEPNAEESAVVSKDFAAPTVKLGLQSASAEPRVVLKRAYSKSSTIGPATCTPCGTNVTLKRGLSADRGSSVGECISQTSVTQTHSSDMSNASLGATSTASVTWKPRLGRSDDTFATAIRSRSNVRRLPAYRKPVTRSASSDVVSKENVIDPSSVVSNTNLPTTTHGVNSDSLEMVLNQATRVHHTRRSLKREACADVTSSTNLSSIAPFASPENSCLTDVTRISPSPTAERTSLVTLHRLEDSGSPTNSANTTGLPSTRLRSMRTKRQTKQVSRNGSDHANTLRSRSSSSSRLAQFLNKLRPNSKGESALHRAAIRGNLNQVKDCLASGMSPDVRDHAGWTPLHEAVLHGHHDIAEVLLNAGATIDVPGGPDLDTPLHDAIQNAQTACCELLLAHGADPILPNGAGLTPLQLVDLGLNKINQSVTQVKQSPGGSRTNIPNSARSALLAIRDSIMSSIAKRHPLSIQKRDDTDEAASKRFPMAETLNPTLSVSFKERRRLRPVLLGTGLNRQQQLTFSRVAAMIRAQVVTTISPDVTHVITGATAEIPAASRASSKITSKRNSSTSEAAAKATGKSSSLESNQTSCPRTLKFLNAVLQGCWVLSFDWIETCAHVKMRVEEEGFEVTGCSTTPQSGAPRRARLAREAGSLGLFYGFRFCFLGEFEYPIPPRNELARLVRTGGAVVVFCRERCSPLRLARLAIESPQPSVQSPWELVSADGDGPGLMNEIANNEEDGESDGEKSIVGMKQPILLGNPMTPLLVVYGSHPRQRILQGSDGKPTPYPIQVVSDALSLIRRRSSSSQQTESPCSPLSAVPASWILDCAAEYTILPLPTF